MRPDDELEAIVLGVLARGQALTGMRIVAFVVMSNHFHMVLRPTDAQQLGRFMCFVNSNLAREIGRRFDWHECILGRRYQAILVSHEAEAQVARLKYILSHGCKEGLVSKPGEWPGANCVRALAEGAPLSGIWFNRTLEFRARRRGIAFATHEFATQETVRLSALPCWDDLPEDEVRLRIATLLHEIERETRERQRQTGRAPLGAAFVRRQNPHHKPQRPKRSPAPRVHAASRAVRRALIEAYREFLAAYRLAAGRLARGDLSATFPWGCFPPPLPFNRGPSLQLGS